MFSEEFFPTPANVIDQIGIDCFDKTVLEPSAGSGNIVDWLNANGARSVLACEKHDQLRQILQGKCKLMQNDFFNVTALDVSHVELIVMNPPFSNADKHILHAWDIAPEGCEIIALCNMQTLDNNYSDRRKQLLNAIRDYGDSLSLGKCFSEADRKTDVEVGLVRLFKPAISKSFDFDGFYFTPDEESNKTGIMSYNEIRAIVNSYVAAVRCFDEFRAVADKMSSITSHVKFGSGFTFSVSYNKNVFTKQDFSKELQRHCWQVVFDKMNIQKWVTSGVMRDINSFIESRKNYPFTMKNVYRMLEIIVGTKDQTMSRAIVEAVDRLTQYTHENRYGLPGWKTNAGHLLNKKFIVDYMVEANYSQGYRMRYSSNYEHIQDLTKALCYVTGIAYDQISTVKDIFDRMERIAQTNTWYSAGFFEYKFFKKGTMHFKFQNEKDWETLNRAYAKAKGQVLPENINIAA
jgi:hypothetical protein